MWCNRQQRGVGGDNSWGARPHPQYTLPGDRHYEYSFVLRPFRASESDPATLAREPVPRHQDAAEEFRDLESSILASAGTPGLRMAVEVSSVGAFESSLQGVVSLGQDNVASIEVDGSLRRFRRGDAVDFEITPVPEPGELVLAGLALTGYELKRDENKARFQSWEDARQAAAFLETDQSRSVLARSPRSMSICRLSVTRPRAKICRVTAGSQ